MPVVLGLVQFQLHLQLFLRRILTLLSAGLGTNAIMLAVTMLLTPQ